MVGRNKANKNSQHMPLRAYLRNHVPTFSTVEPVCAAFSKQLVTAAISPQRVLYIVLSHSSTLYALLSPCLPFSKEWKDRQRHRGRSSPTRPDSDAYLSISALDEIVAFSSSQVVVAAISKDHVIAIASVNGIAPASAMELVRSWCPEEESECMGTAICVTKGPKPT